MSRIELLLALVFLLSLALGSQGCQLREDDRGEDCEIDCTTLSGSVLTQNNEGVPGLQLSFRYSERGLFTGSRYIADFITDVTPVLKNFDIHHFHKISCKLRMIQPILTKLNELI